MANNKVLAIANCRVSSDEQLKNNSLNRQDQAVRDLANSLDAELVKIWSGSVSSKKGKNIDRKDLAEMLEYCKKHRKVKYAIFDEPDRFMRSMLEMGHFFVEFERLGVAIRFATKPGLNTNTAADTLMLMLEAFKAEGSNEERISKSIKGGIKAIEEGRYPYHPKFGYMKGEKAGIHKLHPELGELLRSILNRLSFGLLELSASLEEYNNSSYVKGGKHCAYKMDKWRKIVVDGYYAGIVEMNRQVVARNENGLHEAIITKEQHLKIVQIVENRKKNQSGPRKNGNPFFILNSILLCEKCYMEQLAIGKEGRNNRGKFVGFSGTNGKSATVYSRYKCRLCGGTITRDETHEQLKSLLDDLEFGEKNKQVLKNELKKVWRLEGESNDSELIRLRTQLANVEKEKDKSVGALISATSPAVREALESAIEKRAEEISVLANKISGITSGDNGRQQDFINFAIDFVDRLGSNFFGLTPDEAKKCKLLLFPSGFFVKPEKIVYIPEISLFYSGRATKKAPESAQNNRMVRVKRL